jgi:hypothetical protein
MPLRTGTGQRQEATGECSVQIEHVMSRVEKEGPAGGICSGGG